MRRIFKYELEVCDFQTVEMPLGAELIYIANQADKLMLWALVNPEREQADRQLYIYGTGYWIKHDWQIYIGSAQIGPYVWHVFDGGELTRG